MIELELCTSSNNLNNYVKVINSELIIFPVILAVCHEYSN